MLGNQIADYESPIKVEACFRYDISHNVIFNAGLNPTFSGQIALNVGSIKPGTNMHDGRITGNHVESCGGRHRRHDRPDRGPIVTGNIVRGVGSTGIHIGVPNAIVSCNRVADWGLRGAGDAGMRVTGGDHLR